MPTAKPVSRQRGQPGRPISTLRGAGFLVLVAALVTGVGLEVTPGRALRVGDALAVLVIAGWWLTGGLAHRGRRTQYMLAACVIALAGIGGLRSAEDGLLLFRWASIPLIGYLIHSIAARLDQHMVMRAFAVAAVTAGVLVLAPAIANIGEPGVDEAAAVDKMYGWLYPRDDDGFVYTSGAVVRSRGPYGHPNEAGGILAVLAVATLGSIGKGSSRLLSSLAVGLCSVGVIVTGSRSGMLGLLFGASLMFIFRRRRAKTGWVLRGYLVGLVTLVILFSSQGLAEGERRSYAARAATVGRVGGAETVAGRLQSIADSLSSIVAEPLGSGIHDFNDTVGSAHNSVLFLAAVFGVVVAGVSTAVGWKLARRAAETIRSSNRIDAAGIAAGLLVWILLAFSEDRPESPPTVALLGVLMGTQSAFARSRLRP